eukprot:TRINITY_DN6778_c0_g1_i1.p1 TRINITY_DN6778_c0_g1~~TRINITY_DN6778_c0_g1_i1.p1  ORF type:complete len:125 (-),score=16.84 TRINITY_DN6778_c0_g1_i1:139-513(-)
MTRKSSVDQGPIPMMAMQMGPNYPWPLVQPPVGFAGQLQSHSLPDATRSGSPSLPEVVRPHGATMPKSLSVEDNLHLINQHRKAETMGYPGQRISNPMQTLPAAKPNGIDGNAVARYLDHFTTK